MDAKAKAVECFTSGLSRLVDTYIETDNDVFLEIAENFCMWENIKVVEYEGLDLKNSKFSYCEGKYT